MRLHDAMAAGRDDIILRWRAAVRGTLAPDSLPFLELVDHLPDFIDEIIAALRNDVVLSVENPPPGLSQSAAVHGAQRLRLGFSLDAVVREYGTLRDAIVAVANDVGVQLTLRELQILFTGTIDGIADAVSEYARQRDAELIRQANEHFAFVAHELRNPLSSASMAFQLLREKGDIQAESRLALALERGLRRTTDLIEQTLQAARIASGVELRRKPTTLKALLDDAEMGAISEAESKGIEIRFAIEDDTQLSVDTRLVSSAVGNLVRNAVKYSHKGGVVEVRGQVVNGHTVIEIEDCCGGLAPGQVEAAFAPFVRLDSKQSGFGLGLAIAKQAADAHGGRIRVQNLPGKGCIFVLDLPVAP